MRRPGDACGGDEGRKWWEVPLAFPMAVVAKDISLFLEQHTALTPVLLLVGYHSLIIVLPPVIQSDKLFHT